MTKLVGFGAIAAAYALFGLAWLMRMRPLRVLFGVAAAVVWVAAVFGFFAVLAFEAFDVGQYPIECPVPGHDSDVVPSHWSWLPPGEVCEYPSGEVGPTYWRIPAAAFLIGFPFVAAAVWPRRRAASTSHRHFAAST